MKKTLAIAGVLLAGVTAVLWSATGAMVKAGADEPILHIGATSATLVLPVPTCRPAGCVWELAIQTNPPDGPFVETAYAVEGDLTVPYPAYCGTIQVDVLVGDGQTMTKFVGHRTEIATCTPPPTTTTTTTGAAPSTTTTTAPSVPSSTTTPPSTPSSSPPSPPVSSGGPGPTVTPPAPGPSAPPVGTSATVPSATATPSAQLPRTGAPYGQLAALGAFLIGSGLLLMRKWRAA